MTVQDERADVERIMVGSWAAGERPAPFRYRFEDSTGAGIDLTDWAAAIQWQRSGGTLESKHASVLGDQDTPDGAGWVEYAWGADDFVDAGVYDGNFWVSDRDTNVLCSVDLGWKIRVPATPVPTVWP